jgi:L-malate glycosyltransferase
MQPRVTISAVIITLNEEKNILRCIQSLRDVADEIIVWDAFSTDQTKALSESLGAVVYQNTWEGYSKSKNRANSHATGQYILSIDADEELSPELQKNLLLVKQSLIADAYVFTRLTNYCGSWIRHSGWYPEYKIRLFKKNSAFWVGEIHEYLEFATPLQPVKIKGDLLHYSIRSIEHHMDKIFLYSRLAAIKDHQRGLKPSVLYNGIIKPAFHFFKNYVLQLGFTGGYYGFVIAKMAAFERFLRYVKLKELVKEKNTLPTVLRVLHLSSERYWRGGEQQIAYLIEELRKKGVESYVCARRGSSFEKYCLRNNIPHRALSFSNSIDISTAQGIRKCASDWRINLMHIHSAKSHRLAVIASVLGCDVPMVLSRRVNFALRNSFSTRWKYNHPSIKRILCVSRAIELNMRQFVNEPEKCMTVYSGVDVKQFDNVEPLNARDTYALPLDSVVVGTTAALDESKDPATFVAVIQTLRNNGLNAYGIIVGDGPMRTEVQQLIDRKNLSQFVILAGFRADVKSLLAGFDYFMLTSIEEGLGTSVLDAFSANIPVVATDVGGIPEMVIHETTGMLAPARQAEQLAACIEKLHHSPSLKQLVIYNARVSVQRFSKEAMAEKTLAVYKELMEE